MRIPAVLDFLRTPPKTGERLNQNDWASMMFAFNGNSYPIGNVPYQVGDDRETLDTDFEAYVTQAYKANGLIFGAMLTRALIFTEARFQWQRMNNGRPGDLWGDASLGLLEEPWPDGTTGDLLNRALLQADLAGNHYVVTEVTNGQERLRCLRPDWTDIVLTAPPALARKSDVAGFVYRPGGTNDKTKFEAFPIDGSNGTVAHWCPFPDPIAQYRGMSPLTPILREINIDEKIQTHKEKFFDNGAKPGLVFSLKESVTPEQFGQFMDKVVKTKYGVQHAYEDLFIGGGADVTVVGSRLEQIDFKTVGGHIETRLCMALRVHPALVGVAEGLHGTALNQGNFQAAKDLLADGFLRPAWRSLCASYAPLLPRRKGSRLWYDDRDISFLRQDRKQIAEIQQTQASTIGSYVQQGFTPDSAVRAVREMDISLLQHTGLVSVQLLPPGQPAAGGDGGPGGESAPADVDVNVPDSEDKNPPEPNPDES